MQALPGSTQSIKEQRYRGIQIPTQLANCNGPITTFAFSAGADDVDGNRRSLTYYIQYVFCQYGRGSGPEETVPEGE